MHAPPEPRRTSPERLIWVLRRADQSVHSAKATRLRPHGLTPAQYSALIRIDHAPGISPAELARRLFVSPQAVTGLLARLETAGYVRRRSHALHTTVLELHLTDPGKAILETVEETMTGLDQQLARGLGRDDAELLRSLLLRLSEVAEGSEL